MLDCDLMDALERVHLTYGWKNTHKLWIETRGFTTSLKTAMADYPKSGLVPDGELMKAVEMLRDFPDPGDDVRHTIEFEMNGYELPNTYDETVECWVDERGEDAVRALLKKQADEQRWEDFKNRRDYERIEAQASAAPDEVS